MQTRMLVSGRSHVLQELEIGKIPILPILMTYENKALRINFGVIHGHFFLQIAFCSVSKLHRLCLLFLELILFSYVHNFADFDYKQYHAAATLHSHLILCINKELKR